MKFWLHILGASVLIATAGPVEAQRKAPNLKRLHVAHKGLRILPLRMARAVCTVGLDGRPVPVRVGDWVKYEPTENGIATQNTLAYDEYEFADPTATILDPGSNPTYSGCATNDARFFYGSGYNKGFTYNDLHVVAGAKGAASTRLAWAWNMIASATKDFQYYVFTTENFPTVAGSGTGANDPSTAGRGDYPGMVYSYGPIAQNLPDHYYWSPLDIGGSNFNHHLPNDGNGGVLTMFGDFDVATNVLKFIGEPMLWGLVPGNPTPACSTDQWDDDNPINRTFTDGSGGSQNELYDYTNTDLSMCPPVLGAMMCLFYQPASTETLAPTAENIGLGSTNSGGTLASWAADDNDGRKICLFAVPNLLSPFVRVALDYTTTMATPTAINFEVKAKMLSIGSFAIKLLLQNKVNLANVTVLPQTPISLAFAVFNGPASGNLSDYVGAAGAMTGTIEVQQTGPTASLVPCVLFEYANMKVTG